MTSNHQIDRSLNLPRTYFPAKGTKRALLAMNLAVLAAGILGVCFSAITTSVQTLAMHLTLGSLSLLWVFVGLRGRRGALVARITLTPSSIEVVDGSGKKTLRTQEILGTKRVGTRNARILLVSAIPNGKDVEISNGYAFNFDDTFHRWLSALPNLDAK